MKLSLFSKKEFSSITLPEKHAGHYWVRGRDSSDKLIDIIAVEALRIYGHEGAPGVPGWLLKSNRNYRIFDHNDNERQTVTLNLHELYRIESTDGHAKYVLYTEPLAEDRKCYRCYEITQPHATLTIGRNPDNNIIYPNSYTSGNHAEIIVSGHDISVRDPGSANHTYVNGKSVGCAILKNGDAINIMGLQIIVIGRFIFINNPDSNVIVKSKALRLYHSQQTQPTAANDDTGGDFADMPEDYYYRAPRFRRDFDVFELKLDAPPSNQTNDDIPMIMLIGPSMTMGMASVASGAFAVTGAINRGDINSAIPSIIMSISMLSGTLMWPVITKAYQRRVLRRKEAKRQETYKKYLSDMQQRLIEETKRQEDILRDNDADDEVYAARILADIPQIWERAPKHSDFLSLRLGRGNIPLKANIQYSGRRFTVEQDNLADEMYKFGEQKRLLQNVPVCLSLIDSFISGIYAERDVLIPFAKSIILQITALYSYDEVKLVLLYDERDADEFAFTRWLPHTMNNERTTRYIANNTDEVKELSLSLDAIIERRKALGDMKLDDEKLYYIIICLDKELAFKTECVRRIQEHKGFLKFSVISMFERLKDLPKDCTAVVELRDSINGCLNYIGDTSAPPVSFCVCRQHKVDIDRITHVIANTHVDISDSIFPLPTKYTFLEMLDIGMVEHLNLSERWSANDPTMSLAATVGVDKHGEAFRLDLHERAHGPHGLVAGMTGSGKSEFIIAYILSMAVTYHPYEVAFILIDYKGGGMAKSFEGIPHTAGVITNLDGNEIKRALASMRSELHRREHIFRDTSLQHNVSNIDIYKYQKLYREGRVAEPLPHLIIISDEFAELKKEQPDFMAELTSTARVGRSLGVHLILATQKPGGVVDDQIRSNSRFRVCLKVQDNGDSMEMLGRPEAASITATGRFYLQVGNNEVFEIGQSAWAGASYYPSPRVIKDRDDAVSVINTNGRVIAEANIDRFADVKDPPKQLDVITGYIKKTCNDEHIKQWKMWLDPIPARILIDDLVEKYRTKKSLAAANSSAGAGGSLAANNSSGVSGNRAGADGNQAATSSRAGAGSRVNASNRAGAGSQAAASFQATTGYQDNTIDAPDFCINPIIGEYDDPARQAQGLLRLPITDGGNIIIYGSAGSGKAMFIESICHSLISAHTPQEVNIYMLDFGAETLIAFAEAPHVGDVVFSYETEKVNNLFKLLPGKLETRKKLLSEFGGDMVQYNTLKKQSCGPGKMEAYKPEPGLIVIINNYAAFSELYEDKLGEINYLSREGVKYGIYFILACTGVNNVRFNMLQNFKHTYCLQLNSADDYSSVVGKTGGLLPDNHKGRGVFRDDEGHLLEFQVASICDEEPPYSYIRAFAKNAAEKYNGAGAANIPVLPEQVTVKFLAPYIAQRDFARVPVGVSKDSLDIAFFDFTSSPISLILSTNQEWRGFSDALIQLISYCYCARTIILTPVGKLMYQSGAGEQSIYRDAESCVKAVHDVFNTVLTRNNEYKDRLAAGGETQQYEPVFVFIQSISLLKIMLERYKPDEMSDKEADAESEAEDDTPLNRLQLAMAKCENAYNVYFVVADSVNSLTPFTTESWYKTHIDSNNGIWAGSGINNQYRLTINKKPQDSPADLSKDFGYVIQNTTATLVKLLQSE